MVFAPRRLTARDPCGTFIASMLSFYPDADADIKLSSVG